MKEQHFVTFLSPGTFFNETSVKGVDSWDPMQAMEMARKVTERHGATPYGFYFTTRGRGPDDLDSHETDRSSMFFLGGEVLTLADVKARKDPKDEILISNMENNGFDRVVQNNNSWRATVPLNDGDVVLHFEV